MLPRISMSCIAIGGLNLIIVACSPATTCPPRASLGAEVGPAGYALRFCGTGEGDIDRVKVPIDNPMNSDPGPAADVGATDFTLEWWMKATLEGNAGEAVECGEGNLNWIYGSIVFDRDRFNQGRKYGVSIAGGRIVFGVSGADDSHRTICGTSVVADGGWHHVAVQRRRINGEMSLYVDGLLEARAAGPAGDISYPDDGIPANQCGGPCNNSDPYLVMGAEKHDVGSEFPSYDGWLDEVRLSTTLRYSAEFTPPSTPFEPDASTVALWHFDAGTGQTLVDSSPHANAHGLISFGGPHQAPRWEVSDAPLR